MSEGFKKDDCMNVGRRTIRRGDKVRVKGYRGLWTFLNYVYPRDRRRRCWVDVYKDGQGHRSFYPDKIRKA